MLVDEDFSIPEGFSLCMASNGYAILKRYTGRKTEGGSCVYEQLYVHRVVMGNPDRMEVDHINRDKLDNQRSNLRICDRYQNARNTGGRTGRFKGVHFAKKAMKWCAQITSNHICHHIGYFDSEEHAAQAYNHAAARLHGDFAYINRLPEDHH